MISNSDLKLAALVLQKATLLEAFPKAHMAAPRLGSNNTPTVSWTMRKAPMINLAVAELLRIRLLHYRFFLESFLFKPPGPIKLLGR